VRTGPSSYEKRICRAAASQRLWNNGLEYLKPQVQSSSHVVTYKYKWLHSFNRAWSTTHKRLHACMWVCVCVRLCVCVCVYVCVCERERERERERKVSDFLPSLMDHIFVEKNFLSLALPAWAATSCPVGKMFFEAWRSLPCIAAW